MAAITSTGEDAIARQVEVRTSLALQEDDDVAAYFELERCAEATRSLSAKRVALQFPDALLAHSARVAAMMAAACSDTLFFVLGDTSYGSCCVDEVAAEHSSADMIIHFGHSCLSRTSRIPTLYVFGRPRVDVSALAADIADIITESYVYVIPSVEMCHIAAELGEQLQNTFERVEVAHVSEEYLSAVPLLNARATTEPSVDHQEGVPEHVPQCGDVRPHIRQRLGRSNMPAPGALDSSAALLYLGDNSQQTLVNIAMMYPENKVYALDDSSHVRLQDLRTNKKLMRRYFLVEKAKSAQTVGILLGTLGVAQYMDMVKLVKELCRAAEKKFYTFLVGKVNPAKLANFTEVDVYVMIACPENAMMDSAEFFKPVVTPYELELACAPGREWTGRYELEFDVLLPDMEEDLRAFLEQGASEEPSFSLVSSAYVARASDQDGATSTQLALKQGGALVTASGARNLGERTFQGLEPRLGETPVIPAVRGRRGIAIGYDNEEDRGESHVEQERERNGVN